MTPIAKRFDSKKQRIPVYAGMSFTNSRDNKIRKVGYKIMQFFYDIDIYENGHEDWSLINQKEVKRVITG